MVSHFAKNARPDHLIAVDQTVRYLAGTQDRSNTFEKKSEIHLVWYSDSN